MQDILHVLYFFLIKSNLKKMGLLKSNFQLQSVAKLVRDTFYPFRNGSSNVLQTSKRENTINDLINAHFQVNASYLLNTISMLLKSY